MNAYERAKLREIALRNNQISRTLDQAMKDLAKRYQTVKGKRFAGVLTDRMAQLQEQIKSSIDTGVQNQWHLANEKK
jgi:cytidylate kinase